MVRSWPEINIGWLLTGDGTPYAKSAGIPILSGILAGDIKPVSGSDEVIGYVSEIAPREGLFALVVNGDSMFPEIHERDVAICDQRLPFLSGQIHAVGTRDYDYTLKRVFERKKGYELVPSNPEYRSVFIHGNEVISLIRVARLLRNYPS